MKKTWREINLERRYNLTIADYNLMLEKQNFRCNICNDYMKSPEVDEDHENGKIRALLCHQCNLMMKWADANWYRIVLHKQLTR